MKNVAKRILNQEAAGAVLAWKYAWIEDRNQKRGERVMKRVGARFKQKEVRPPVGVSGRLSTCVRRRCA